MVATGRDSICKKQKAEESIQPVESDRPFQNALDQLQKAGLTCQPNI
ncbi:hypothetical protein NBRC3188_2556 [Acetobacter pasteurianus NBRC 3188]|uniref:Uncharacterized protein n=1 Tax=Acetobacter pasteurianus NBRC 3188 TaxID=1226663 RepID=A0A401WWY4_ACEPA|nr:hypothetical protein NBRC3188_2556 [Acetobacter pasteurianus NBRC 3188]